MNAKRSITALIVPALLPAALATAAPADPAGRPNILFIMTDDHAAHAMSCYGSRVNQTPNLDRIATGGMRFDNCFCTNSICTPSRATIITGKYSHINGVPAFNRFDGSQPTVAKYLQAAGYYTGMIGKWHLGSDPTGFDYWEIFPGQGRYFNPILYTATQTRTIEGYATDVVTDLALEFLKNRPKDKPFFLMYHHKAPHRAWDPDEKHKAMFANKKIPEPPTLRDDYATRTDAIRENEQRVFDDMTRRDLKLTPPPHLKGKELNEWLNVKPTEVEIEVDGRKKVLKGEELNAWKYQRYMQDYLACVQSVDTNVGRVLDWLDANGLTENTMVIYTSDQGFYLGDHGMYDKRFMYEESLRMPFVVRWPKVIKPGSVQKAMALNVDFAPTFLEAAGLPVPADMQGRSLMPLFRGEKPADWRTSMYYRYYHDPGHHNTRAHYGVRTETHKLIYFWKKDQWELFDLVKDPQELKNVYGDPAYREIAEQLKAELYRLKKELKDEDQFADKLPPDGVDGLPPRRGAGS
ncbi:MAG TPA: sulfatase [Phycisphaerae bacterium]|jgi:arylsulfatase A-like enzyme|nr:sulfatase [Phycisphaerae bacterium]HOB74052.1 sulfatase [Phycisphaerae bacterium]HOJ53817.1 sulfatase [Phycisphaerae bacterium]HOL26148.1 sulfatase [Phycisphaerae bacterium]HPP20135.1 sulfatase [Phycisphaerae bacterium]